MSSSKRFAVLLTLLGLATVHGASVFLNFDLQHGTVITNQYLSDGITISATGGQNIAIVYDSELGGASGGTIDGQDTDLERLGGGTSDPNGWDGGNLGTNYNAGGLLIIQENPAKASPPTYGGGAVTSASNYDPDDNGGGGTITFEIDQTVNVFKSVRFILADFEEGGANYSTTIFGSNGNSHTVSFSEYTDPLSSSYDPSITSGDNHINALPWITVNDLHSTVNDIKKIEFTFINSSGAISAIEFSTSVVPEPTSALSIFTLSLVAFYRRRSRSGLSSTGCPAAVGGAGS